ncbi:MAG: alpha/beta hydrolase [Solobacterium sp.]|nr:alpha/beta hydrolase [Solobacterium sp.]
MGNMIINILMVFAACILLIVLYYRFHPKAFDKALAKNFKAVRDAMRKESLLGTKVLVPRENDDPVVTYKYVPNQNDHLPVVFVLHGGAYVDGVADQIDTFCSRLKSELDAVIVNIDYTSIDVKQIPNPQNETRDTILWYLRNFDKHRIDLARAVLLGFGAGAHCAIGAYALLQDYHVDLAGVVSVYPLIDDSMINLIKASLHPKKFALLAAKQDPQFDRIPVYKQYLDQAGIVYPYREYDCHNGFIEKSFPEFTEKRMFANDPAVNEEEAEIAQAAIIHLTGILRDFMNQS